MTSSDGKALVWNFLCHAVSTIFRIFHLHNSIYHAEFSEFAKFHKNPLQIQLQSSSLPACQFLRSNGMSGSGNYQQVFFPLSLWQMLRYPRQWFNLIIFKQWLDYGINTPVLQENDMQDFGPKL